MPDQKPKSTADLLAELATAADAARTIRDDASQVLSGALSSAGADLVKAVRTSADASEAILAPLRQKLQEAEAAVVKAEDKFHTLASARFS